MNDIVYRKENSRFVWTRACNEDQNYAFYEFVPPQEETRRVSCSKAIIRDNHRALFVTSGNSCAFRITIS
jgi:hypothetical protein